MPQGIQTWDASGRVTLDITERLTVLLGTVYANGSNGSVAVALPGGEFWALVLAENNLFADTANVPEVTYESGRVVWRYTSWSTNTASNRPATIMYGVY